MVEVLLVLFSILELKSIVHCNNFLRKSNKMDVMKNVLNLLVSGIPFIHAFLFDLDGRLHRIDLFGEYPMYRIDFIILILISAIYNNNGFCILWCR